MCIHNLNMMNISPQITDILHDFSHSDSNQAMVYWLPALSAVGNFPQLFFIQKQQLDHLP